MPLLLITATPMEGREVREALTDLTRLEFPLGELYSGSYAQAPLFLAHLGIGKVNTAAGLALALEKTEAEAVLQFGIGGAFPGSCLAVGDLAVATAEVHLDSGVRDSSGWHDMEALGFALLTRERSFYNVFPTEQMLTQKVQQATGALAGAFGTSETVTGTLLEAQALAERHGTIVESMEGAAAAQVCLALGMPFAELRAVSNPVGERDKSAWDIKGAVAVVNSAVLKVLSRKF